MLVPPCPILLVLIPKVKSDGRASWNNEFLDFAKSYKDDFPDFINLKSEMDTWETYWTKHYVGVVPERVPAVSEFSKQLGPVHMNPGQVNYPG